MAKAKEWLEVCEQEVLAAQAKTVKAKQELEKRCNELQVRTRELGAAKARAQTAKPSDISLGLQEQLNLLGNSSATAEMQAAMEFIHSAVYTFQMLEKKMREKDEPKVEAETKEDEFMDAADIEVTGGDEYKDLQLDDE